MTIFHHISRKGLCRTSSRKAQLSIFLILAIVILIGGGVYFLLNEEAFTRPLPTTMRQVIVTAPVEIAPVTTFVEQCLRQTAEEALDRIGEQGGYLSITSPDYRVSAFSVTPAATESDAIVVGVPDEDQKDAQPAVPYWWYLKSPNSCTGTCELASKRPEIVGTPVSIEGQLSAYVGGSVGSCLDFSSFERQGFSIEGRGEPKVTARIGEEDVQFLLDYPLHISRNGITHDQEAFLITEDVRLKKLYDLATEITNLEMQHRFLEKYAIQLIVGFSGLDQNRLPPFSDLSFEVGSSLRWSKRQVEKQVTSLFPSYVQLFQVQGTDNFRRDIFQSPLKQRMYDSTIIPDTSGKGHAGISAEFTSFDSWPIYFDLNCNGDSCEPTSAVSPTLSVIGLQSYRFAYDISYPVMVELRDNRAFHGRGYTFRFALEANVRNNKPMESDFTPLEMTSAFSDSSLLCDEDQRSPSNVTVKAIDDYGKPIPGASLLYTVIDESCFIGVTDESGALTARFPGGAVGGAITIVANGAVQKTIEYTPGPSTEQVPVSMSAELTKRLKVMKKRLARTKDGWQLVNFPQTLGQDEEALVTLKRIPGPGEQESLVAAQLSGGNSFADIQIAPGRYEANIRLIIRKPVAIPDRTECSKPGLFSPEVCYTVPGITFLTDPRADPIYEEGGFVGNITIPAARLLSADTIILYAIAADLPASMDDLIVSQDVEGNSNNYLVVLQPNYESSEASP
ncbi:TPA: hypothetical protein HA281_02275 [Candidatus Woesearchaeota archaeon]|nr:MAG: hypothetical protein QT04_C0017G0006 [archaeon GW2011_AR11]HIH91605.1 hypothetical protein [Candidatus Woesearchaeota archaeon]HII64922.1 hypothetical protein [Candidatus Woesearchaeota archaeon]HIJ18521.1 hypothetical protein [Candidatus Woesearchaeota archaeon]